MDQGSIRRWRSFNVISRLLGGALLLWGAGFCIWGIYLCLNRTAPFWVDGTPSDALGPRLATAVMSGLMAAAGAAMLWMKPYRPDLGDVSFLQRLVDPFGARNADAYAGPREWWTGDRKS